MEFTAEQIASLRRKLLYKISFHLGRFCPDAEDLAQEAFMRFFSSLQDGKIRDPQKSGAFLNGVCNNVIHEYRRRIWREPAFAEETGRAPTIGPDAVRIDLQDAIEAGFARLSARDARILRSFLVEEKSKDEICQELGLSDAQFRVILHRAKDRFRQIYQKT
jgi:RNA polymerase sigma-70 factor, ECF subfamily